MAVGSSVGLLKVSNRCGGICMNLNIYTPETMFKELGPKKRKLF